MTPGIALLVIGGILLVSGWKNQALADVFDGTNKTDPGGAVPDYGGVGVSPATGQPYAGPPRSGNWTPPSGGASSFRGPSSALLDRLASIAQNTYHLRITATTNGGHVPGSYHYQGRAFDAAGSEADMHNFAAYCETIAGSLKELIHNPGFGVKDGRVVNGASVFAAVWQGHKDHVHVAA